MKKLVLLLLFVTASFASQGQVVIMESFDETTFAPSNWQNQNVSGPWFWERVTSGYWPSCVPHSGSAMATFQAANYFVGRQAALVTPVVDLSATAGKTVEVSFWMYRDNSYANYDSVVVSVGTTQVIANSTKLGKINRYLGFSPIEATNGWYNYTFTIPVTFNGASNYIFFNACGDAGGNIYMDDVSVRVLPLPTNDAGVGSFVTTKSVAPIGSLPIKSSIRNFGSANLTSATINWSVNGVTQTPFSYTNAGLLSGANSAFVTLGNYNFAAPGIYSIQAWTTLPNGEADGYSQNDLRTTTVEVREFASLPYTQNFDGTWIDGTSTRDIADTYILNTPATGNSSFRREDDGASAAWTTPTAGGYATSGANSSLHSARYHSKEATANGQLDFHVNLAAVGSKKLTFSSFNSGTNSSVNISLSVDSGATFTTVGYIYSSTTALWQRYEFSLGTSVSHAAIVRFSTPANQDSDFGIDQVYIGLKSVNDGGITDIVEPTVGYASGVTNNINVNVKNYGSDDLNSAIINWSVDGVVQTPFSYVNSFGLSQNSVDEIAIGNFNFPSSKNYALKVWLTNPNGSTDGDIGNDAIEESVYVNSIATLPYSQTFETDWINQWGTRDGVTNSWKNEIATGNESWRRNDDGVSASWSSGSGAYTPAGANSSSHSARYHSYNTSSQSSLVLNLNMTPVGNKLLIFWYINTDGNDKLTVAISTDGGTSFTNLKTVGVAATWTQYQVSLGNSTAQRAIVKFLADGDYGATDLGLDDVSIQVTGKDAGISAFTAPTASFATSVQDVSVKVKNFGVTALTSAQIGWSVNGVLQTPKSYSNGGLATLVESTPISLGNYDFASAGNYKIKAWTSLPNGLADEAKDNDTLTINVYAVGALNIPYTENFDAVTAPALPEGMLVTNDNADSYFWKTYSSYSYSGSNAMYIRYNSTLAMNDWFFTPPLNLVAGKNYDLSFWYRSDGTFTEKLQVKFGTSASAAGMTGGTIYDNSVINSSSYANGTCVLTPSVSGVYYVGFHGYSNIDMNYILVDDISITDPTATPIEMINAEDGETVSVYPSPVSDVLNLSSEIDFEQVTIVNTLGQVVWRGDSYAFPLNTTGFLSGVYTIVLETKRGNRVSLKFIKR